MLKLELELRSQYFFISYLASIRSSIYPRLDGDLSEVPSIFGIQTQKEEGRGRGEDKRRGQMRGKEKYVD